MPRVRTEWGEEVGPEVNLKVQRQADWPAVAPVPSPPTNGRRASSRSATRPLSQSIQTLRPILFYPLPVLVRPGNFETVLLTENPKPKTQHTKVGHPKPNLNREITF